MRLKTALLAVPFLCFLPGANAAYDFHLKARANIADGYRLPAFSSFLSGSVSLNHADEVAIPLSTIGGEYRAGIWSSQGEGGIVFEAATDKRISGMDLGDDGEILFQQVNEGFYSEGLFVLTAGAGDARLAVRPRGPRQTQFFRAPQWAGNGRLGFGSKSYASMLAIELFELGNGSRTSLAEDIGWNRESRYTYLFTPSYDSRGNAVAKARIGEKEGQIAEGQPDRLVLFRRGGARVIAEDRDADPQSPFLGFHNGPELSENGDVIFGARVEGDRNGLFRWSRGEITPIAVAGDGRIGDILFFHPSVNSHGDVAFRGRVPDGREAIFVETVGRLRALVKEHDLLPADLGTARVDQHKDDHTVFCGGVEINDRGTVAFCATLTPHSDKMKEWGSGVYLAKPRLPPTHLVVGGGPPLGFRANFVYPRLQAIAKH